MSQSRDMLALRRQQLVARSSQVREKLTVQSTALLPLLMLGDRARAAYFWVRNHPGVVISISVAVVVARPRVVWRWGWRVWSAVRFIRGVRHRMAAWERR